MPLAKAARLAPEKSSIREALGRAYFRSRHFAEAAREFEAVVERYPVNDYAHFCLGRALTLTGQRDRARHHLALAVEPAPRARDYRLYRERLRRSRVAAAREGAGPARQPGVGLGRRASRSRRSGPGCWSCSASRPTTPRPRRTGSPTRCARCGSSTTPTGA